MSAGIILMNKKGIALAADSAGTIKTNNEKVAVFNSNNKVFRLSEKYPIGAIVVANAEFMGVPINLIIQEFKIYIDKFDKEPEHLEDYRSIFNTFLLEKAKYFQFKNYELTHLEYMFSIWSDEFERFTKKVIDYEFNGIETDEAYDISIMRLTEDFKNAKVDNFNSEEYLINNYIDHFLNYIHNEKGEDPDDAHKKLFSDLLICFFQAKLYKGNTEIAFIGYGSEDIYPSFIKLKYEMVIDNKIKCFNEDFGNVSEENPSLIVPLAQSDVISTYLSGIDMDIKSKFISLIKNNLRKIFNELYDLNSELREKMLNWEESLLNNVNDELEDYIQNNYNIKSLNGIKNVEVNELIKVAETLIDITSLKRHFILDKSHGTVGGPTDTATITKHQGFKWIKIK